MNKTVQKTAAEERFVTLYDELADALPGTDEVSRMRREAIDLFQAKGLPHRRVEEWRYTDLKMLLKDVYRPEQDVGTITPAQLDVALGSLAELEAFRIVFVDGRFAADLSRMPQSGSHIEAMPMTQAWKDNGFVRHFAAADRANASEDAVVALNTALMADGMALHIAGKAEKPVHLVHVNSGTKERLATLRHHIHVAEGAALTLLETHVATGEAALQSNGLIHIGMGKGAQVNHVKFQNENRASTHLATLKADLEAGAVYNEHQFNLGGALVRNQHFIRFAGENASYDMSGASLLCDKQHCDTALQVDHAAPACKSRETLKAVLDGRARAIFQARVVVQPVAQKTDGKQMMRGLMLSEEAEFYAKPELEIYADDVECGHGATSGKIDEDLLFYLRSRGIGEKEARGLLIQAFVGEVVEHVADENMREALGEYARNWLASQTQ